MFMKLRIALCFVVSLLVACTKTEPVAESAACCTNEATPNAATSETAATAAVTEAEKGVPDVVVSGVVGADAVAISVQNHAKENVKLKARLHVEKQNGQQWTRVNAGDLALRWSCETPVVECVMLSPGAEWLPPAWPAKQGRGACGACADCPMIAAGSYRVIAETCDGSAQIPGETFVIAQSP